jgi:hypothetical protein
MYIMGARRRRCMPFWPPLFMVGEHFVKNVSSPRIKLITQLFYQNKINPS